MDHHCFASLALPCSPAARRAPRSLLALATLCTTSVAFGATVDLPRYPSLSPDGSTVCFSWRGDLWSAPCSGGASTRLTSNVANETRSAFTPDGTHIVFESDREGTKNLWSINRDGGELTALTDLDASFTLSSVGLLNGAPTIFIDSSLEGDLYRATRPFVLPLAGGTPVRLHDAFGGAATPSPDGTRVLFERGGSSWARRGYNGPDNHNIWLYDANAKSFTQLTKYDGNDGIPRFINADEYLSISDRATGSLNLHRGRVGGGLDSATRLTDFTNEDIHGLAVSTNGAVAVFTVLGDLYRLDLNAPNAKPEKVTLTAADDSQAAREFKQVGRSISEAALSPDGKTFAMVSDGDVFVRATEEKAPTRRVTDGEARERDLCWSADGMTLYFASDRDGSDSLYAATVAQTRAEARAISLPAKEKPAATEAKSDAPAVAAAATDAKPAEAKQSDENKSEEKKSDDKKPDDKKPEEKKKDPKLDPARWADALRIDIAPLTSGADNDRRPVASPDGKCVLFTRNLADLARLDLTSGEVKIIHPGWDDETEVVFSPDGTLIALAENDQDFNKDIWVLAADGSQPAVNITRHPDNDGNPRFSADNKVLAFLSERTNEEFDAWVVMLDRDLEGLSARDLDQHFKDAAEAVKKRKPLEVKAPEVKAPEVKAPEVTTPEASAAAVTPAEVKPPEVAAAVVTPPAEQPAVAAATEPAAATQPAVVKNPFEGLELDDAYLRVKRVTTLAGNEGSVEILPSGERFIYSGTEGKERGIFSMKYDGSDPKKVAGAANVVGLNFAGDRIVAVMGSSAQTISLTGETKSFDISAVSEVELAERNAQKLGEISRILGVKFYVDPATKGLDWPALTARYRDLASRCVTSDEFDFIANMFIGHLDASHLGVRSSDGNGPSTLGATPSRRAQGRLGVTTIAATDGRAITAVLPNSPAALCNPPLMVGDVITTIDFEKIDASKPLEVMLAAKIGQEVFVGFTRPVANAVAPVDAPVDANAAAKVDAKVAAKVDARSTMLVPMSSMEERSLRYKAETLANAAKVDALSHGRIGYIHIQAMDQGSLDRFERDLYAAANGRDALIVDVRNNGGGSTADLLLASIDVRRHAYAIPREGDRSRTNSYPQDRLFIQRYTMPMSMLCNEKSFSNAEIISHAFKTLSRGRLVGQQTAGGVISTGSESLVDGTTVRLPMRGWFLPDGTDMEEHGAMPDLVVVQTPQDEARAFDAQLEKAVDDLMKTLPN